MPGEDGGDSGDGGGFVELDRPVEQGGLVDVLDAARAAAAAVACADWWWASS